MVYLRHLCQLFSPGRVELTTPDAVIGTEWATHTFGTKELPRLGDTIVLHREDPRRVLHKEPEGMSEVASGGKGTCHQA